MVFFQKRYNVYYNIDYLPKILQLLYIEMFEPELREIWFLRQKIFIFLRGIYNQFHNFIASLNKYGFWQHNSTGKGLQIRSRV